MKKLGLILILITGYVFGQVKNGEAVPDINFKTILNSPVSSANLSILKGKVVLLEFWATWCGSCIVAMPHLQKLQQQYKDKLQVIAINDETVKRTKQFLAVKPFNYWFAVDTNEQIAKLFPHQMIPHTVLIGADGLLIANTDPEAVTGMVIDSMLNRQAVHLPEKKDNAMDYEEIIKTCFFAADTVKNRFMMMPEIKGAPGVSTIWLSDSTFNGRRITGINLDLTSLYRIANNDFPYNRMIDSTGLGKKAPSYCLDLIVADKKDLRPALKRELAKRFDIQALVIKQEKDVYVLQITDPEKFKTISLNTSGKRTYYARHGEIDQQAMTMTDFADYLEDFGISRIPVIDETGNVKKFDIKFSFQPENPASLTKVLSDMGLSLQKQKRPVDMLLLYKQKVS